MKDEIKEILEALKPQDEEFTKAGIKEYPLVLSVKEQKILLDYITNLQEENKDLKEWLNNVCFDGWNENVELALRYLLRIGYISFDEETREYINHNINDPIYIGEEERKYNNLLDKLDLENQDYKSRKDKAVEYIENDLKSFLYSIEYKTLLNILNGGDKE